jgi:hypothetical protein
MRRVVPVGDSADSRHVTNRSLGRRHPKVDLGGGAFRGNSGHDGAAESGGGGQESETAYGCLARGLPARAPPRMGGSVRSRKPGSGRWRTSPSREVRPGCAAAGRGGFRSRTLVARRSRNMPRNRRRWWPPPPPAAAVTPSRPGARAGAVTGRRPARDGCRRLPSPVPAAAAWLARAVAPFFARTGLALQVAGHRVSGLRHLARCQASPDPRPSRGRSGRAPGRCVAGPAGDTSSGPKQGVLHAWLRSSISAGRRVLSHVRMHGPHHRQPVISMRSDSDLYPAGRHGGT